MAEVADTIAGLDALGARLDEATREIVGDLAHMVQASGMAHAPVGLAGNSTNMPGDLRRSILVDGPHGGDGVYEAQVGPTTVYGRQRELGGSIYPHAARMLRFEKFGAVYYRRRVHQRPEPYMLPADLEVRQVAEAVAVERLAAAITGA